MPTAYGVSALRTAGRRRNGCLSGWRPVELAPAVINGLALGHPLGATGTKLTATPLHALNRRRGHYGLQTTREGSGMANVTLCESVR